jgi:hypothetical protein
MRGRLGLVRGLLWMLLVLGAAGAAPGATLVWDPVPGEVTGYKVHYGTVAGSYSYSVNVGPSTSRLLDNLPNLREGVRHYFSVTSYNESGESAFSPPLSWTPPDKTPPSPPVGVTVR